MELLGFAAILCIPLFLGWLSGKLQDKHDDKRILEKLPTPDTPLPVKVIVELRAAQFPRKTRKRKWLEEGEEDAVVVKEIYIDNRSTKAEEESDEN